jgi:hypothetical protein
VPSVLVLPPPLPPHAAKAAEQAAKINPSQTVLRIAELPSFRNGW